MVNEAPEGFIRWPQGSRGFLATMGPHGMMHISGAVMTIWGRPEACHIFAKFQAGKNPIVLKLVACQQGEKDSHYLRYRDGKTGALISCRSLAREMGVIDSGKSRSGEAYLDDDKDLWIEFEGKVKTRDTLKGGWGNLTGEELELRKQRRLQDEQQEQQRGGKDD